MQPPTDPTPTGIGRVRRTYGRPAARDPRAIAPCIELLPDAPPPPVSTASGLPRTDLPAPLGETPAAGHR